MRDPAEGVSSNGTIVTGAGRARVSSVFEPIIDAAIEHVESSATSSLYLYGSVATGMARVGESDVDLLAVDLPASTAARVSGLSRAFADRCRAVEIAAATSAGLVGSHDEAYGNRVFLRHYCVHLAGVDHRASMPDAPADAAAARGFNGDIAEHAEWWRLALDGGADPADLGRRVARKALLAVAGLVSIHDHTWTTDRQGAAERWTTVHPGSTTDMAMLLAWSDGAVGVTQRDVTRALDGAVADVVDAFRTTIGLWSDPPDR